MKSFTNTNWRNNKAVKDWKVHLYHQQFTQKMFNFEKHAISTKLYFFDYIIIGKYKFQSCTIDAKNKESINEIRL